MSVQVLIAITKSLIFIKIFKRELTPDEEESPTSSSSPPSWLAFIVGAVSGAVVITMFVTSLLIFRLF